MTETVDLWSINLIYFETFLRKVLQKLFQNGFLPSGASQGDLYEREKPREDAGMDPHLRWQIVYVCFCMLLVVMIITLVLMLMKKEDAGMDPCERGREKVCNDHDGKMATFQ